MDDGEKELLEELERLRRQVTALKTATPQPAEPPARQPTPSLEQKRAQQYLDIAEVILVGLDRHGDIVLLNRKGHRILGYQEGELLGKNWFDTCIPPPISTAVKHIFEKSMAGQAQVISHYENPVLTRSGEERIVDWHNTLLLDEEDNIIGTLSSGQDITESKRAQEALERRAAQLAILNDISRQIATLAELDTVLDDAIRLIQEHFGYHHVSVLCLDHDRNELLLKAMSGDFAHLYPVNHRLHLGQGMVGWVAQHGETLLTNDVRQEPRYVNLYPDLISTRSELSVPIRLGHEVLGVLDVQSPEPGAFDQNDVRVMETLADQIAVAMENARLYGTVRQELAERRQTEEILRQREQEIRWRAEALAALHETALDLATQRMSGPMPLPDLLRAIVARAVDLLQAKGGGIYLYRPKTDDLEFAHAYRLTPDYTGTILRRGEGLSGKVLDSGRSIAVADYSHWPGQAGQYAGAEFAATVAVPITWRGRPLGVLDILADAPRTFSPSDVALLERFAPLAAAALENNRLLAAEHEQRELAETLRQVAQVLNTSLDREQVLPLILEQLAQVIEYDNASVMLVSDDLVEFVAQRGLDVSGPDLPHIRLQDVPHVRQALESRQPGIIADVQADPRWLRWSATSRVRCWLGVPLIAQERAIGLLNLGHKQPGFYTEHHARIVQGFAAHAALAIENSRLFAQTRAALEELQQTEAHLIQSAKMAAVGSLAAGVAHELNNPLTVVLGFAELSLYALEPGDPVRDDLEVIVAEAHRARDIVQGLLTFSRQSESFHEKAQVNQTIQETLTLVRRQLEKNGISLVEQYSPDLPPLLLAVGRMKQVFLNLIGNALDAMPRGGILTIRSEQVDDQVRVRFADTGMGMSPEQQARLFEPFYTTKPVGQGTGLGLAVSLGIVQEHGGRIEVESREGQGSTFTVWLPVEAEAHS